MSRKANNVRRIMYLVDAAAAGLEARLPGLLTERLTRERDPFLSNLIKVESARNFELRAPAGDDGTRELLFKIDRKDVVPAGISWTPVTDDAEQRRRLKEATRWWANETAWVTDVSTKFDLRPPKYGNILKHVTKDGLHVLDISHYRLKVSEMLFQAFPGKIGFLPFMIEVTPPSEEESHQAAQAWFKQKQSEFDTARVEELKKDHAKPYALTNALYYRTFQAPGLKFFERFATEDEAERGAQIYRGLCFVVNLKSGSFASRWADR